MKDGIVNAVIESAELSVERGFLTGNIMLDYGNGGHQGTGAFGLYSAKHGHDCGGLFVFRVLQVAGAEEWGRLRGRPVRVRIEGGLVSAVGHYLKDDWFSPHEELVKAAKEEKGGHQSEVVAALEEIVAAADEGGWDRLDATFSRARAALAAALDGED
jgi:hypothetical protein